MTFYTTLQKYEGISPPPESLTPSLGEYLGAAAQDAWNSNPTVLASRSRELHESISGSWDVADDSGGDLPIMEYTPPKTNEIDLDSQAEQIKSLGLEGMVKPTQGYTQEALDIVTSRKFEENEIKEKRESAPMSYAPLGLAVGLGASLADPVNIASAFFPVMGEARALSMLRGASGAWGRAGVRAGIGAAEGAVGAAVVEPMIYAAKTYEQADYDMADSLLNVGFGAIFGAALQPASGAVGELMRAKRGQRNPWEIAAPTDATENMRFQFADDMHNALVAANPEMDRAVSDAAAALFDARARTWSHDMGRGAGEYYTRYKPEFMAGEQNPAEALQHAMNRSNAPDVDAFIAEARTGGKSYLLGSRYPTALQEHFQIDDLMVNLPYTYVRHLDNQRSAQTDALVSDTQRVLAEADSIVPTGTGKNGEPLYSAVKYDGDQATLVAFALSTSKKKGNRVIPISAYINTPSAIDALVKQKRRTAPSAGGDPSLPTSSKGDEFREDAALSDGNLNQIGAVVNESTTEEGSQFGGADSPRASVNFEEDGKAVIRFFDSVDPTSAPHELYHIFRRELAETAADAAAPARVREDWKTIDDFVGSRSGEVWSAAQEERFAKAGEKFLMEGVAPAPAFQNVFDRLKQWFTEIYTQADAAGIPISDGMRKVFGNMLSMEDADAAFRYALGDLHSRNVEQEFAIDGQEFSALAIDSADVNTARAAVDDSALLMQEHMEGAYSSNPEQAQVIAAEAQVLLQGADDDIAKAAAYREAISEAALCETRR